MAKKKSSEKPKVVIDSCIPDMLKAIVENDMKKIKQIVPQVNSYTDENKEIAYFDDNLLRPEVDRVYTSAYYYALENLRHINFRNKSLWWAKYYECNQDLTNTKMIEEFIASQLVVKDMDNNQCIHLLDLAINAKCFYYVDNIRALYAEINN